MYLLTNFETTEQMLLWLQAQTIVTLQIKTRYIINNCETSFFYIPAESSCAAVPMLACLLETTSREAYIYVNIFTDEKIFVFLITFREAKKESSSLSSHKATEFEKKIDGGTFMGRFHHAVEWWVKSGQGH